jgi:hypothetical protein
MYLTSIKKKPKGFFKISQEADFNSPSESRVDPDKKPLKYLMAMCDQTLRVHNHLKHLNLLFLNEGK